MRIVAAAAAKTPVEPQVASGIGGLASAPSGAIRRSEVRQALNAGLGMFLQRVTFDVEHPVFRDHKFVGFRIADAQRVRAGKGST